MARYIDKDKALLAIDRYNVNADDVCSMGLCIAILSQPEKDVAPIVHAKWENGRCTNCHIDKPVVDASVTQGYMHRYAGKLNYCPNCGAKMEEEE